MNKLGVALSLLTVLYASSFHCFAKKITAPEYGALDLSVLSYEFEKTIPSLPKAFFDFSPADRKDGLAVGRLAAHSSKPTMIKNMAESIAENTQGNYDSLLISHRGKLVFESYYSRGRINLPHFQMSATKSFTSLAIGRAIELGYLSMADLNKPITHFFKNLNWGNLAQGVENITLHRAMTMRSGLSVDWQQIKSLRNNSAQLDGNDLIQGYLQHSTAIPASPSGFRYQNVDATLAMQVLNEVVPGSAKDFIVTELLNKMEISDFNWKDEAHGLAAGAYGTSMTSRDMVKWGQLVLNKGMWKGEQLVSREFIEIATSDITASDHAALDYGYFWWNTDMRVDGKSYATTSARGGGGQYILVVEELDLVVVATAHNKLGSDDNTIRLIQYQILPAFL